VSRSISLPPLAPSGAVAPWELPWQQSMEFYLSIEGEKHGPVSLFRVGELLREGSVTPETLGWHRDLDGWLPLEEISSLESVIEREWAGKQSPSLPPEAPDAEPRTEPDAAPATRRRAGGGAPAPGDPGVPVPPEGRQAAEGARTPRSETLESPLGPGAGVEEEGELPAPLQAGLLRRFWARMFDYLLVTVVVFLVSDVTPPQPAEGEAISDFFRRYLDEMQSPEATRYATTQFFALVAWHFLEAVLIHLVGATPGKWLFRIQVVTGERRRLPLPRSLVRSFFVYLLGVGLYLMPLILIALAFSFFRIMATGRALWDQTLDLRVEGQPLSVRRIVAAVFAFLFLMMLQSLKFS